MVLFYYGDDMEEQMLLENDMISELNSILINVPQKFSPLEKAWWIYKKTGLIFSYDFRASSNTELIHNQIDFEKNTSNYYQTCWQISDLLCLMFNNIEGLKAKVIETKIEIRGQNADTIPHRCVELIVEGKKKYILDLTMDLFHIQSGMLPRYFAQATSSVIRFNDRIEYVNDSEKYSVLSRNALIKLDKKTQLNTTGKYTDDVIEVERKKFLSEYTIDYYCHIIRHLNFLLAGKNFRGQLEGKKYITYILNSFLSPIGLEFKEYNLIYKNSSGIQTAFEILNENIFFLYSKEYGVTETSLEGIKTMMNSGWSTASETLKKKVFGGDMTK